MARTALEIDRAKLEQTIKNVELNGPKKNRSVLHELVAGSYNASNPPVQITPAVVGLRIKEWQLVVVTPMGKRGRQGPMTAEHIAAMQSARGKRKSKAEKFAKIPGLKEGFEELRRKVPERFLPLVDRLENGSRTAGIALHCLDCMGYTTGEVKRCSAGVQCCAMWPFRPYQKSVSEEPEVLDGEEIEVEAAA